MNKKLRYFAMLLLMAVTSGAWAAVNPLAFKKITETTLVYTTAANLAATGYAQDGKGTQTYNTPSDRGKAMDPTNEESYDFAIGTNGVMLKSAGSNKEVLLYVTNVTMLEVYCKCNSSNDRYPIITATPSDGTAATTVNGSPLNSSATASGKTAVTLDASKNYTISIHSNDNDITLYAMRLTALTALTDAPTITTQPQSASYGVGDSPDDLTVEATASAGDLEYQWYECDIDGANAAKIGGATDASFTPSTSTAGTFYYFCEVTDDNGSTNSGIATITVRAAELPTVGISPASQQVSQYQTVTITATINGGFPEPTIQWYSNTENSTIGGTAIEGATSASYSFKAATVGTEYYYFVASNSAGDVTSDVATVTIVEYEFAELASVSEATTWDWSNTKTLELKDDGTTFPKINADFYTIEDIAYINGNTLPAGLDGTTIAFSGQYPYRSGYAQACVLRISTTVPGSLKVTFSNTGGSNKGRYVQVTSGKVVQEGTVEADGTTKREETFAIPAGIIDITGYNPEGGTSALRFMKIEFTPATDAEAIAISDAGYATHTTANAIDFSNNEKVQAFIVDQASTSKVHFAPVTAVPAGTPIVVKSISGDAVVDLIPFAESATAPEGNLLKTPTEDQQSTGVEYCLANKTNGVGFYPVREGVAIKKAYLIIDTTNGAPEFIGFLENGGTSTGISTVAVENAELNIDAPMYNIAGQRVSRSYKGVVIQNGKKFIVK